MFREIFPLAVSEPAASTPAAGAGGSSLLPPSAQLWTHPPPVSQTTELNGGTGFRRPLLGARRRSSAAQRACRTLRSSICTRWGTRTRPSSSSDRNGILVSCDRFISGCRREIHFWLPRRRRRAGQAMCHVPSRGRRPAGRLSQLHHYYLTFCWLPPCVARRRPSQMWRGGPEAKLGGPPARGRI